MAGPRDLVLPPGASLRVMEMAPTGTDDPHGLPGFDLVEALRVGRRPDGAVGVTVVTGPLPPEPGPPVVDRHGDLIQSAWSTPAVAGFARSELWVGGACAATSTSPDGGVHLMYHPDPARVWVRVVTTAGHTADSDITEA